MNDLTPNNLGNKGDWLVYGALNYTNCSKVTYTIWLIVVATSNDTRGDA
jgi:hypothetical protein